MYTNGQYQIKMTTSGLAANSSGVVGLKWSPGFIPHVVRAFSGWNTSTLASGDAMVASLTNRALTATTATIVATINGNPAPGYGKYVTGLNKKVTPGQELALHISTGASGAALMAFTVWVEPVWEEPANNSLMSVST